MIPLQHPNSPVKKSFLGQNVGDNYSILLNAILGQKCFSTDC